MSGKVKDHSNNRVVRIHLLRTWHLVCATYWLIDFLSRFWINLLLSDERCFLFVARTNNPSLFCDCIFPQFPGRSWWKSTAKNDAILFFEGIIAGRKGFEKISSEVKTSRDEKALLEVDRKLHEENERLKNHSKQLVGQVQNLTEQCSNQKTTMDALK